MRTSLLAAAAIGALLTSPVFAQTDNNAGTAGATTGAGAMTQQDMENLGEAFEQAGFTGFRPVTGGDVFRGMNADGNSAVIAVAPDTGNTASGAATTGDATGTGMADSEMFQVMTAEGRTLYVVVPPEMTGMAGMSTTGSGTGDTDNAGTAETTSDADTSGAATADASAADNEDEETTGADTTGDAAGTTTADTDATTGGGGADSGDAMTMNVELTGAEQVPPVETSGQGQVQVTFDSNSRELSWKLDYSDLSSDATAAHFHGPADPGETAPPVIPVDEFEDGAEGSATLTEEQAEQLMAGKMYFNLHTENNPNGEIRGQVTAVQ